MHLTDSLRLLSSCPLAPPALLPSSDDSLWSTLHALSACPIHKWSRHPSIRPDQIHHAFPAKPNQLILYKTLHFVPRQQRRSVTLKHIPGDLLAHLEYLNYLEISSTSFSFTLPHRAPHQIPSVSPPRQGSASAYVASISVLYFLAAMLLRQSARSRFVLLKANKGHSCQLPMDACLRLPNPNAKAQRFHRMVDLP